MARRDDDTRSRRTRDDDDDEPQSRSRSQGRSESGGDGDIVYASFRPEDTVSGGGSFGPGPARITRCRFGDFDYAKKGGRPDLKPALIVEFDRDGEKGREPYSVGKGWQPMDKGLRLGRRDSGSPGMQDTTNCWLFLQSLMKAKPNGMPTDFFTSADLLEGVEGVLSLLPVQRDFGEQGGGVKTKSLLVFKSVEAAPWIEGSRTKTAKASRARDEEPEPEKPRRSRSQVEPDGEEAEAKPAMGRSGKGKPNGAAADLDEEAIEAVLDVLGDGPIAVDELEAEVKKFLRKHPEAKAIAARAAEDDFLELERGWALDPKKGTIALDK